MCINNFFAYVCSCTCSPSERQSSQHSATSEHLRERQTINQSAQKFDLSDISHLGLESFQKAFEYFTVYPTLWSLAMFSCEWAVRE